jgi:pyruvate formate-lyase activating enzyme-like uncharacterized protein
MEIKRKISKSELVEFINSYKIKELSKFEKDVLYTLEHIHYVDVLDKIKIRQDKLKLYQPNQFLAFYKPSEQHQILPSCVACLDNKITHIRHSDQCNCNCDFCYFKGSPEGHRFIPKWAYRESMTRFNVDLEEIKLLLGKQLFGKVKAIGWLEKEPLMDMDKMIPLMEFINLKQLGGWNKSYQYLYTNGILATEDNLKRLKDAGLSEIRFNLQATDFSDAVLSNMVKACEIIDNVCIETPIYSKSFKNMIKYKELIKNSGIKQINMPELQLSPSTFNLFNDEGMIYRHRRGYVSPVSSRHYVYDLIELAIKESWPLVINDCSNDTKFYRGVSLVESRDIKCGIAYRTAFSFLPPAYYLYIVNKYVQSVLDI